MSPEEFLNDLLPTEGYRCIAVKTKTGFKHRFFSTNTGAAQYIKQQDEAENEVYFAVSAYTEPTGRKQDNVLVTQVLFLDVDVGPGKSYADAGLGCRAMALFCRSKQLPYPTIVCSGKGLHVYWQLRDALAPGEWKLLAEAFQRFVRDSDLKVDDLGLSTDAARILRPIGTHNRKDPLEPLPVFLVRRGDVVSADDLQKLFGLQRTEASFPARPAYLDALKPLRVEPDHGPLPLAEDVAAGCAQLAAMRATRGVQPEPVWHGCLGLLAYCFDGEEKAHDWSQGDERYDACQVDEKLSRWRTLGPPKCDYFRSHNPALCVSCSFRGATPVQLGRAVAAREIERGVPRAEGSNELHGRDLPEQPEGYQVTSEGLMLVSGEVGVPAGVMDTLVCALPIYLSDIGMGEATAGAVITFSVHTPFLGWTDIAIPGETASRSDMLFGAFGKSAIPFANRAAFFSYLQAAQAKLLKERKMTTVWEQYGWKGDRFFYGDRLYSPGSAAPTVVKAAGEAASRSRFLKPSGDFNKWREAAQMLHMKGCEPQAVALHAAFASVLMPFHVRGEGGAILSLFSSDTNNGKSTALTAAASVWGELEGLHLLNSSTLVARSLIWAALCNLPVVYDECTKTDPGILRQMVEIFTTGHDRQRGQANATLKHASNGWQMIMITGGNQSLVETLEYDTGSSAQAYRILELMPRLPKDLAGGDNIKRTFENNYGFAGDFFMRYLVGTPGRLARAVEDMHKAYTEIQAQRGWSNDYRFWLRLISALKVSMQIVREAQIMEFDDQRLFDWLVETCNASVVKAPLAGSSPGGMWSPEMMLTTYINTVHGGVLAVEVAYSPTGLGSSQQANKVFNCPIVGRYERKTNTLYLSWSAFSSWLIKQGQSPKTVRRELTNAKKVSSALKSIALAAGVGLPSREEDCLVVLDSERMATLDGNVVAMKGAS